MRRFRRGDERTWSTSRQGEISRDFTIVGDGGQKSPVDPITCVSGTIGDTPSMDAQPDLEDTDAEEQMPFQSVV
jgi:hypothetical protein